MTITFNGNGTVTGVSVGGLPDGIVDTDMLAAGAVTKVKRTHSAGEIIQTQAFVYTAVTETYNTRGFNATPVTKQITPASASNKILVMATLTAGNHSLGEGAAFKVMRSINGGTYAAADATGADAGGGSVQGAVGGLYDQNLTEHADCRSIQFLDAPNTTSTVDYKLYVYLWDTSKPVLLNRPNTASSGEHITGASSLVLMEIAG